MLAGRAGVYKSMNILALDTTGTTATVALVGAEFAGDAATLRVIGELTTNYDIKHSRILMPLVERLLALVETDIAAVDYFACASGPGSFTGLRICAATVKALAHAAGKPVVAVPTLDALAYNVFNPRGLVVPVMDARRGEVYTAVYAYKDGEPERLTDYMACPVGEILDIARGYAERLGKDVVFAGDGASVYAAEITAAGADVAPAAHCLQRAASVGSLAAGYIRRGMVTDYNGFEPFYIRKSQAEREYDGKNNE